ncbi:MAG: hypothetical protein AAF721_05065 [Myxococcota bacterium]
MALSLIVLGGCGPGQGEVAFGAGTLGEPSDGTTSLGSAGDWHADDGPVAPVCDEGDVYAVPATAAGAGDPPPLPEAGCYTPCSIDGDDVCPEGEACTLVSIDPCSIDPCAADVATEELCLPGTPACVDQSGSPAFLMEPGLGDEDAGTASCTVVGVDPLSLDCEGSMNGVFEISFASELLPPVSPGQVVEARYEILIEAEWAEEWFTIVDDAGDLVAGAVQASSVAAPAGWPLVIESVEAGCGPTTCSDGSGQFATRNIKVGDSEVAPGDSAQIVLGTSTYALSLHVGREGACGANWVDSQPGWFVYTVVAVP